MWHGCATSNWTPKEIHTSHSQSKKTDEIFRRDRGDLTSDIITPASMVQSGPKTKSPTRAHAFIRLKMTTPDSSRCIRLIRGLIFISTDADPGTGASLISKADGKRHYELFEGNSSDEGKTWNWSSITANSTLDNLRPLVPKWNDPRTALVWMRGNYTHNHGDWTTAVVALVLPPELGMNE